MEAILKFIDDLLKRTDSLKDCVMLTLVILNIGGAVVIGMMTFVAYEQRVVILEQIIKCRTPRQPLTNP